MKKLKKMSRTKKENQKKSIFKKTSIKGKINMGFILLIKIEIIFFMTCTVYD